MRDPQIISLKYLIHSDFDSLQEVFKVAEEAIHADHKRRKEQAETELGKLEPGSEEYGFWAGIYDTGVFQAENDFPRILRYAFLAGMMGTVETNIVRLTEVIGAFPGVTETFNHKKSAVVDRAIQYIEKNAGIDTSRMDYDKRLSKDLSLIRNCVVHNQGKLGRCKEGERIKKYLTSNPSSRIDNEGRVWLDEHFVGNHLHVIRHYLYKLCEAVDQSEDERQLALKTKSEG